ncbi:MAG: hypothetical protein QME74_04345 [Candidatus Edwardsbacteria bacterium]|nr:hypothetical protein [Candidatus Edwardsbacteria bacterium]
MPALTEAQQRSFIRQMIEVLQANQAELKAQGYDAAAKVKTLSAQSVTAEKAEQIQLQAMAALKAKTADSVKATKDAYELASAQVEAIVGALGKKHPLAQKVKGLRDAMSKPAARGKKKATAKQE